MSLGYFVMEMLNTFCQFFYCHVNLHKRLLELETGEHLSMLYVIIKKIFKVYSGHALGFEIASLQACH